MIIGAHSIIYSMSAEADRAFLRDVLKLNHVDVGEGRLIFGLPPSEMAIHPSEQNGAHEFYFMCDNVEKFMAEMGQAGITTEPVQDMGWGLLTQVRLPGGGKIGVYQPRHAHPKTMGADKPASKPAAKAAKRPARKPAKKAAKKASRKSAKKPVRKPARKKARRR